MGKISKFLVGVTATAVVVCGTIVAGGLNAVNNGNYVAPATTSSQTQETIPAEQKRVPEVVEKVETKNFEVSYRTITEDDPTMAAGTSKVVQEGRNGTREETYKVTYKDGVETNRELLNSRISVEPQHKIIRNGTYVKPKLNCQNGSYINSSGQEVCRPSSYNNGGATAICRDGTYSYSQHRRGTCSYHGGVARWL